MIFEILFSAVIALVVVVICKIANHLENIAKGVAVIALMSTAKEANNGSKNM